MKYFSLFSFSILFLVTSCSSPLFINGYRVQKNTKSIENHFDNSIDFSTKEKNDKTAEYHAINTDFPLNDLVKHYDLEKEDSDVLLIASTSSKAQLNTPKKIINPSTINPKNLQEQPSKEVTFSTQDFQTYEIKNDGEPEFKDGIKEYISYTSALSGIASFFLFIGSIIYKVVASKRENGSNPKTTLILGAISVSLALLAIILAFIGVMNVFAILGIALGILIAIFYFVTISEWTKGKKIKDS